MNKRQRIADSDMRYMGRAWRAGYYGPPEHARGTSMWQQILQQTRNIPFMFDDERVEHIHARWLIVADTDRYSAAVLKLHYRDGYRMTDDEITSALNLFSLV